MKKTTAYARRQKRQGSAGHSYNGAAWAQAIQRCKPYDAEPVLAGFAATQTLALESMTLVRSAFEALKSGQVPANDEQEFDKLSHALGVACIRAGQIAGEAVAGNPMLEALVAGNAAMRRCLARRRSLGVWGLDGPAISELTYAIEVYETILQASSPAQMAEAVRLRNLALKGRTLETIA